MGKIFSGMYEFRSPYSPDLKPVELLGVCKRQNYIRKHEDEAIAF